MKPNKKTAARKKRAALTADMNFDGKPILSCNICDIRLHVNVYNLFDNKNGFMKDLDEKFEKFKILTHYIDNYLMENNFNVRETMAFLCSLLSATAEANGLTERMFHSALEVMKTDFMSLRKETYKNEENSKNGEKI